MVLQIAESSNGKTTDFGSVDEGSTPSSVAILEINDYL